MYDSTLDLIYVGSEKEMMMIEGSADQIPEDRFVEALEYAHEAIQDIIEAQKKLAELCGKPKKNSISFRYLMMFLLSAAKSPETVWKMLFLLTQSRSVRWLLIRSRKKPLPPAKKNLVRIMMKTM